MSFHIEYDIYFHVKNIDKTKISFTSQVLDNLLLYDKYKYTVNTDIFSVPNIVVEYNKYMNKQYLEDKRCKTPSTPRKERKIYMIFSTLY